MKLTVTIFVFVSLLIVLLSPADLNAEIKEGDTLKFWSVSYVDWLQPPLPAQKEISAVCKKVGEKCYVFVEADYPGFINQQSIDNLVSKFDTSFTKNLVPLYGPIPDALDKDPRIFILAVDSVWWGGYFDPTHQMPDSMVNRLWNIHSSEREIIYITVDALSWDASGTVAHEFGHMLQWGQDHSPEPRDNPTFYWEDTWIDEGFSTFAAVYLGGDIYQSGVFDYSPFFAADPNTSLIYFSSYSCSRLYMIFMFEHYGGKEYIKTLISDQANGIKGVRNTLSKLGYKETFEDTFEHWVLTNYLQNKNYMDGKYSYNHYDFPAAMVFGSFFTFPNSTTHDLKPFGSDYLLLENLMEKPLEIKFEGDTTSKFRVAMVFFNSSDSSIQGIKTMNLNNGSTGKYIDDSSGIKYDRILLAVMNIDTNLTDSQTGNYKINFAYQETDVYESADNNNIFVYPNPANDIINIDLKSNYVSRKDIEIYSIDGSLVQKENCFDQTIRLNIGKLQPGSYLIKVNIDGKVYKYKFVK